MNKKKTEIKGEEADWRILVRDHVLTAKKPLIVVLGATASGKTGFSLKLARWIDRELKEDFAEWHAGAEIVNADSRQLYQGLDIGTAKIRDEEMDKIPHHLLDMLDPREELTVSWYKERAEHVIEEIQERGNVPILVGGSMLYISAIIDGLVPLQPADAETRSGLEEQYDRDRGVALYDELQALDPETASAFHRHNKPYLVRAMELHRMTGKKPSELKVKETPKFDTLIFGMHLSKTELDARIEKRTQEMFDAGWIQEVEDLLEQGFSPNDPGMKSTGYREIAGWLQDPEAMEKSDLIEMIAAKTRQYAKRQMTWWKEDERIRWVSS